jgi:Domain of unknown function (DUF4190)
MQDNIPPIVPDLILPAGAQVQTSNGLAITSLLLGLVSLPLLCLSYLFGPFCACPALLSAIVAFITGFVARNQIKTSGETGNGMALTGMVIGGAQVVLLICSIVFSIAIIIFAYIVGSLQPGVK